MIKEFIISALYGALGITLGVVAFALLFFVYLVFQCSED